MRGGRGRAMGRGGRPGPGEVDGRRGAGGARRAGVGAGELEGGGLGRGEGGVGGGGRRGRRSKQGERQPARGSREQAAGQRDWRLDVEEEHLVGTWSSAWIS